MSLRVGRLPQAVLHYQHIAYILSIRIILIIIFYIIFYIMYHINSNKGRPPAQRSMHRYFPPQPHRNSWQLLSTPGNSREIILDGYGTMGQSPPLPLKGLEY